MNSTRSAPQLESKWIRPAAHESRQHNCEDYEYAATSLSRLNGFQQFNRYRPDHASQGLLDSLHELQQVLCKLSGLEALSYAPVSNAQAVFCCLAMVAKYHLRKKQARKRLLCLEGVADNVVDTAEEMQFEVSRTSVTRMGEAIDDSLAAVVMPLNLLQGQLISSNDLGRFKDQGVLHYVDGQEQGLIPQAADMAELGVDILQLDLAQFCQLDLSAGVVVSAASLQDYLPTPRISRSAAQYQWAGTESNPLSIGPVSASAANIEALLKCYAQVKLRGVHELQRDALTDLVYQGWLVKQLGQDNHCDSVPYSAVARIRLPNSADSMERLKAFYELMETARVALRQCEVEGADQFEITLRHLHRLDVDSLKQATHWLSAVLAQ